ncbi:aldo/keto reductase [Sulfobacillus thermosulfidooxidans]|uniref:aldo/keto reductase n=1 Tax=Sulfobacillus thermosulfidooxidans TaxID=28034 RepID=UPI0006B4DBDE|nr:aldo/keto reductase [Sulfobacillus thermosulfidooxidans]
MEYRVLGRTGEQVSIIGFGALEIGRDWGIGHGEEIKRPSVEQAATVLHHVLDLGINIIDTASAYHQSEARIGQALSERRHQYFLATKCGEHNQEPNTYYDFSYHAITMSIEESLARLRTSQIDLLQIHFGPNPRNVLEQGETVKAMREAKNAGKVRFLGASCEYDLIDDIIALQDFDVVQLTYNLLDRRALDAIKKAADHAVGVLIRFPLAMGWLTPRAQTLITSSSPQADQLKPYLALLDNDFHQLIPLALQFIAQRPEVSSILVGTKNVQHLDEAVQAINRPLPPGILDEVNRLAK